MNRIPWTRDQLEVLVPKLEAELADIEAKEPEEVQPLPPLTKGECLDYLYRLCDIAVRRALTQRECFILGQLFAGLEMATLAESFGKKGRYYVISEDNIKELVQKL